MKKKLQRKIATALLSRLAQGYHLKDFRSDLMAGLIVGMVAIPLSMALAIATGVAPQFGLYTAIFAGALVALLGGSRFQVTGPTAAFVVILEPIVSKFGLYGLLTAGLMSGLMLLIMGLTGMGQLIQFIPHPVTTGFTAGIALVIATMQLKDFFGLSLASNPDGIFERLRLLAESASTLQLPEFTVALTTLALLLLWPRFNKKIPAPLLALLVVTAGAWLLHYWVPTWEVATIATRFAGIHHGIAFQGIPSAMPEFHLPWVDQMGSSDFVLNLATLRALVPSAFAIALLGAIESLLSAVIADGMTRTRHNPDAELVALGIGNMICPFFGGIPATGAIARTATNIRSGAVSPIASIIHALFILLALLLMAPLVSQVPMAALAAMLLLVAWRMSEARNFMHIVRVAPKSDVVVLLTCFGLTVIFDMVMGVSVGVVLAALLFMRRMADLTSGKPILGDAKSVTNHSDLRLEMPPGVLLFQIAGPLFFGATRRAVEALHSIADDVRVVIFDMSQVPVMDVSGLVALESAIDELRRMRRQTILTGVTERVNSLLQKSSTLHGATHVAMFASIAEAVRMAKQVVELKARE